MKKLLILILFPIISFAQKDTIPATLKYGGVTIEGTLIIPKQSFTGGVTKNQLDSAVSNKALQSYVSAAILNLQLSKQPNLTAGSNIQIVNNVISATGGGGGGGSSSITFTGNGNFIEAIPSNYNPALKQGKFMASIQEFPLVNPDPRSNVVGNFWGYNTTPGGGQLIPGEASYRFAGETYFDVGGAKLFEFHLPEIFTNSGYSFRPFSMYINRASGQGSMNMQMEQVNYKLVSNGGYDWLSFSKENSGNVKFTMRPQPGGNAQIDFGTTSISSSSSNGNLRFTGGNVEFQNAITGLDGGGVTIGYNANGSGAKVRFVNGNGGFTKFEVTRNGVSIFANEYASNAAAKAAGLTAGENYYTRVNGIKVVAQVE